MGAERSILVGEVVQLTSVTFVLLCVIKLIFPRVDDILAWLASYALVWKIPVHHAVTRAIMIGASFYLTASAIEWWIHFKVMHDWSLTNALHIKHHLNVNDGDMSLKASELDGFEWWHIAVFAGIGAMTAPYFKIWGVRPKTTAIAFATSLTVVGLLWNNVHNAIHDEYPQTPLSYGPPRFLGRGRLQTNTVL